MKTFSNTLNKGGQTLESREQYDTTIKDVFLNSFTDALTNSAKQSSTGMTFDTDGIRYDEEINVVKLINETNITRPTTFRAQNVTLASTITNDTHFGSDVYGMMNQYRMQFNKSIPISSITYINHSNNTAEGSTINLNSPTPSLFNPFYALNGGPSIAPHTPKLDDVGVNYENSSTQIDTPDPTIKNLVNDPKNILGNAKYRYSDFMYCNDLGKVSNNHLLTLRRFPLPVGDNIYSKTSINHQGPDIGRLVTWFGTDDNKLEDILHYSFHSTWKEIKNEIDDSQTSREGEGDGIVGKLSVITSKQNLRRMDKGLEAPFFSNHSSRRAFQAPYKGNEVVEGKMFDQHRVYEPANTTRRVEIYDGALEFTHNFTLTFKYKLRAYDNINPKAAFLDLLGTITHTLYNEGKYWPGENRLIGTQRNQKVWDQAQQIVNKTVNKTNQLIDAVVGVHSGDEFIGLLSNTISSFTDSLKNMSFEDSRNAMGSFIGNVVDTGLSILKHGIGSWFKNKMGRPNIYAFNSLIHSDNTGLWHLTIGNPFNPIASLGNLIVDNTEVIHEGPLGFDDFPTGLKVVVSLHHAASRDAIDIQRIYTGGQSTIQYKLIGEDPAKQHYDSIHDYYASEVVWSKEKIEDTDEYEITPTGRKMTGGDWIGDGDITLVNNTAKAI